MRTHAAIIFCLFLSACGQGQTIDSTQERQLDFYYTVATQKNVLWVAFATDLNPQLVFQESSQAIPSPNNGRQYLFNHSSLAKTYTLAYLEELSSGLRLNVRMMSFSTFPQLDEHRFFDVPQTEFQLSGNVTFSRPDSKAMIASSGTFPLSDLDSADRTFEFNGGNQTSDLLGLEYLQKDALTDEPLKLFIERNLNITSDMTRPVDFNIASPLQSYLFNTYFNAGLSPEIDVRYRTANGTEISGLYNATSKLAWLPVNNAQNTDLYYIMARDQQSAGGSSSGFDVEYLFPATQQQNRDIDLTHITTADDIFITGGQVTGLNTLSSSPVPLTGWTFSLYQAIPASNTSQRMDITVDANWLGNDTAFALPDPLQFSLNGRQVDFIDTQEVRIITSRIHSTHPDALLSSQWKQTARTNDRMERLWALKNITVQ